MADILPSVLQTCKGAAGMQRLAMIRPETHIHLWFNENKNKVHHTTHEKTEWKSAPWKFKRFWPNPIFCRYLWGSPAHDQQCTPHAAPPHNTALPRAPCTSLLIDSFPDGNNSLLAPHSNLSPNSLARTSLQ